MSKRTTHIELLKYGDQFIIGGNNFILPGKHFGFIGSSQSKIKIGDKTITADYPVPASSMKSSVVFEVKPVKKDTIPEHGDVPVQYGESVVLQNKKGEFLFASGHDTKTGGCGVVYFTKKPTHDGHIWSFKPICVSNSPFISYVDRLKIIPKRYPDDKLCFVDAKKQCNVKSPTGSFTTSKNLCINNVGYMVLYKPFTFSKPLVHACTQCSGDSCTNISTKYQPTCKTAQDSSIQMCKHDKGYTIPLQRTVNEKVVCFCDRKKCSEDSDCPDGQSCYGDICFPTGQGGDNVKETQYIVGVFVFILIIVAIAVGIYFIFHRREKRERMTMEQGTTSQKPTKQEIQQRLLRRQTE